MERIAKAARKEDLHRGIGHVHFTPQYVYVTDAYQVYRIPNDSDSVSDEPFRYYG